MTASEIGAIDSTIARTRQGRPAIQPEDEYQSLADACRDGDVVGVQRLLRWGPFALSRGTCSPPIHPPNSIAWLRVDRLSGGKNDIGLPTVVELIGGTGPTVYVAVGATMGEAPTITIGVDEPTTTVDWIQSLASPAVQISPVSSPAGNAPREMPIQGGIVARIGLGTEPREPRPAGLLETLLTIPSDNWWLYLILRPSNDGGIDRTLSTLQFSENQLAAHASVHQQQTEVQSVNWVRSDVERSLDWLDVLQLHAATARAAGGWLVDVWVGGTDPTAVESIAASFSGGAAEWGTERMRWTIDRLMVNDRASPTPTSFVSNEELASMLRTPAASVSTLQIVKSVVSGRRVPRPTTPLWLGHRLASREDVSLDLADLEGHAFVTGTTGSGKTTTTHRLLAELWNRHRIPFLVVDPVKDQYEQLDAVVDGGIHLVRSKDLHFNVLEAWPGYSPKTHIDSVGALFKAAFTMPSPIPYVADRLFRGANARLSWGIPITLHDLRDDMDALVTSLGYSSEIESNIRAALGTRLDLLLDSDQAELVAAVDNSHIPPLMDRPTVITLADTADPDTRGFVMANLALLVGERARSKGPSTRVRHVTVLEEAHTIMPQTISTGADPDSGNSTAAASKLLTRMLAEMRSFGESIWVVDQSPSSVDREVIRNTNLKIGHRILDPDDREVVGGALGLDDEASAVLGSLSVGEGVISTARILEPIMIKITPAEITNDSKPLLAESTPHRSDEPRVCCPLDGAVAHHHSEQNGDLAEDVMSHFLAGIVADTVAYDRLRLMSGKLLSSIQERDSRANSRCLAYVGLRRSISNYARLGLVPPMAASETLQQLWLMWTDGLDPDALGHRLKQWLNRDVGPFAGCAACDVKCQFRVLASSIRSGGATEARRFVSDGHFSHKSERLAKWAESADRHLSVWVGDQSRAVLRCSVVQALDSCSATWDDIERTLSVLQASSGPTEQTEQIEVGKSRSSGVSSP